ncbi:mitochondrial ribosomal protein S14 [Arctopsyche grandis]|uniref:mitochondrial ribosomal protein S14 n=1 Tax=Arctopsyche grandis TaxID=121162 RepID=UPI00406D7ECC
MASYLLTGLRTFIPCIASTPSHTFQQIRNRWQGCRMIRDVKRRRLNAEHYYERLRINSLRKTNIIPLELRDIADAEIAAFPNSSTSMHINNRCAITSRPRGVVIDWRLSRIVWRSLADYNKLSGVQRAKWGFTGRNTDFQWKI